MKRQLDLVLSKSCMEGSGDTPISWSNTVDRLVLGPKLLKEMEEIVK